MIKNDGRDFSGTHEKFNFKPTKSYNFKPKLGSLNYILKNTYKSRKLDTYIKKIHRRSFKLSIKYFWKILN